MGHDSEALPEEELIPDEVGDEDMPQVHFATSSHSQHFPAGELLTLSPSSTPGTENCL